MTRVATGSRLHFGLFNLGSGPRRFGGVGLMIEMPATVVAATPAADWSAAGPLAERALAFAKRMTDQPHAIVVEQAAPEHAGLGCGTQLALAIGKAIAPELNAITLASKLGRGLRSAVGLHGFQHGGFLVEAGKVGEEISPLTQRCDFPADWRIVLAIPPWGRGLHDAAERQAFAQLHETPGSDYLERLVHQIMLPALADRDLPTFGEAVHEFNCRVGERFAPVQGGCYAHPRLAELADFIRKQGVPGVGQSSWGPALFALVEAGGAASLCQALRSRFALSEAQCFTTAARNQGAGVQSA